MRRIVLDPPELEARQVTFRWRTEPRSDLYARESFNLRFGGALDPGEVPDDLWWVVALLCLHPHWPLLAPCRVELPVELAPGERELWLRMCGADDDRPIEICDEGPPLEPAPAPRSDRVALAFSGGKDSLLSLGLLLELGERPVAVTTTAPMPFGFEHAAPRRRTALESVGDRPDCELVEVRSNLRQCWDNDFPRRLGHDAGVADLTDPLLYLAFAVVVGWHRAAGRVVTGGTAELGTPSVAVGELLRRRGVGVSSLTASLQAWQVRRLLWDRYPDLRELQYSCDLHEAGTSACDRCPDCLALAMSAVRAGVAPGRLGIDLGALLDGFWEWRPELDGAQRGLHGGIVRELEGMRTRSFALHLARAEPRRALRPSGVRAVRRYTMLRGRLAGQAAAVPAPGYRHDRLELVDERWRGRLADVFDAAFERAPAPARIGGA